MKKLLLFLFAFFVANMSGFAQYKDAALKDDPHARWEYEYNMLKSPLTGRIPENIHAKELMFFEKNFSLHKNAKDTLFQWVNRGPWNVGGRTRALAFDISDTSKIVAGGVSGGIWISTDQGQSWTRANIPDIPHSLSVTALAQDPTNPQVWYFGGGEYLGNSASAPGAPYRGSGIYKSTDGGNTWTLIISSGDPTVFDSYLDYIWDIKVDGNGYLYVASYGRIYQSKDGGQSLNVILNSAYKGKSSSRFTDIEVASDGTLYVAFSSDGTNSGIFKSTDTGQSWTDITPNFAVDYGRMVIAAAPSNPNIVYFLGITADESSHVLWKYDNSTDTWTDLSDNIPMLGGQSGDFDSQGGYDLIIKVKPDDENVVFIGGTNLFRSTSGFSDTTHTSWVGGYTPLNNSYRGYTNHHSDQHSLAFNPLNPLTLVSGHDGGISLTYNCLDNVANADGETIDWISLDNGYLTTQNYVVGIDHESAAPNAIIASFQDNGTWLTQSTDPSQPWEKMFGGDGAYCFIAEHASVYYVSSQRGNTYAFYYDNGNYVGWTRVNPDLANPLFINPYTITPDDSIMVMIDGAHLVWHQHLGELGDNLYSSDPPAGWTTLPGSQLSGDYYSYVKAARSGDFILAGTMDGKVYKISDLHTGSPVVTDITGSNFPSGYVISFDIAEDDPDKIIVAFSNYGIPSIFYTEDGGQTWTNVSGNLEENPDGSGSGPSVRSVAILNVDTGYIYFAGTSIGLFSATELSDTTNWTIEGQNTIHNVIVNYIDKRDSDKVVVVGTHGNGIFSGSLQSSIPTYAVNVAQQNLLVYPNPAHGIANIQLPEPGGKLVIYDQNGRIMYVSTPHSKLHKAYIQPLPAGQYYVVYYSKNAVYSQKLIVK